MGAVTGLDGDRGLVMRKVGYRDLRIKELRKARRWTQPVLAQKAGASPGYFARLETVTELL